jgi:hypothetical protein
MIKPIIRLLHTDLPTGDPDIDFAKGAQKYPSTYREAFKLIKQKLKRRWQRAE